MQFGHGRRTRRRVTPLGACARGIVSGTLGSAAQSAFIEATHAIAPRSPEATFASPEPEQQGELATQTMARRFVELFMQRGPLSAEDKKVGGQLVHYGFGAGWGGTYGLLRESLPDVPAPLLAIGFSTAVWLAGDNLMLPAFRLAAWPNHYPARTHAYAWIAHVAYGAGVATAYALLKPRSWRVASLALRALLLRHRVKGLRGRARRILRPLVNRALEMTDRAPLPRLRNLSSLQQTM